MHPCDESTIFPMKSRDVKLVMMCFDPLPEDSRNLTGNYFADTFKYLKLSLVPCGPNDGVVCKTIDE